MYSILNETGKKPNDVPFHKRNVGLRSNHIGSFHMLSALLMTISTLPFRILAQHIRRITCWDRNVKNINNKDDL